MVSIARPEELKISEELNKPQEAPDRGVWKAPAWYEIAVQQVMGAENRQENEPRRSRQQNSWQNSSADDPVSTDLSLGGLFKKGWRKDAADKADQKRLRDFKPCERDEPFVPGTGTKWRHLFDKRLTQSDVAKFNRLVIPSKYGKHFAADLPSPSPAGASEDVVTMLSFVDEEGKLWRFRYKYWAQSKACVITSRWIYFVRDKGLEAQDEISFYRHTETNKMAIGFTKKSDSAGNGNAQADADEARTCMHLISDS